MFLCLKHFTCNVITLSFIHVFGARPILLAFAVNFARWDVVDIFVGRPSHVLYVSKSCSSGLRIMRRGR